MQVGAVYALPSVVATTPAGLRITIGYGQPFLVECYQRSSYVVRAISEGRLLDARFLVPAPKLQPRPRRTTRRRARCH